MTMRAGIVALAVGIGAVGCAREGGEAPARERAQARTVDDTSARTPWIAVRAPDDLSLIEVPAHTVGEASAHADVASVFTARVIEVHVRAGDRVQAGDPLVDLSVPELTKASAVVRGTRAEMKLQRQRRDELDRLRSRGLVGTREVFAVDARLAQLRAEHEVAAAIVASAGGQTRGRTRGHLRGGLYSLLAPTAGVVMEVNASPGEVREASAGPLVSLVAESAARIEVSLARPLPPDAELVFLAQDGRSVPLSPDPVSTAIEPDGGMTRAWFVPRDASVTLPHGLRGRVRVRGVDEALLQVPARALRLRDDGGAQVVVRNEDGSMREVGVEVVTRSGSAALVRSDDLSEGDLVAADAALVLGVDGEQGA